MPVQYNNQALVPAPTATISTNFDRYEDGLYKKSLFTITLKGKLFADRGGVFKNEDGAGATVDYTDGILYAGQNPNEFQNSEQLVSQSNPPSSWSSQDTNTGYVKQQALHKKILALYAAIDPARGQGDLVDRVSQPQTSEIGRPGFLVITGWSTGLGQENSRIECFARVKSIEIPEGGWNVFVDYTITLESEYIRNPIEARARFECEPPAMEDAYFRDPDLVRKSFMHAESPVDEDGIYKPWFNNTDGHRRFIHIDLGLKRDRSALCMSHCAGFKEIKTSMGVENLPVINVDLIHSWEAAPGAEINFSSVRQMIIELCRKFDVAKVTFDRWQSIEMIQSLKAQGINADFHSVKKTDYDTLMTTIYDTRLRGYWNELLVEEELLKLRLFANNKIDHPNSGSKDLADALAGSVFTCVENMSMEMEVDIEILGSDFKQYEEIDDMEEFGTVRVYNNDIGQFVPGYDKQTLSTESGEKWLESL